MHTCEVTVCRVLSATNLDDVGMSGIDEIQSLMQQVLADTGRALRERERE